MNEWQADERIEDDKYITFKRSDFMDWLQSLDHDGEALFDMHLHDAVVIRRRDLFASPALGAYASCIAIVARTCEDDALRKRLLIVSDYFHQQAMTAADEGYHLPD